MSIAAWCMHSASCKIFMSSVRLSYSPGQQADPSFVCIALSSQSNRWWIHICMNDNTLYLQACLDVIWIRIQACLDVIWICIQACLYVIWICIHTSTYTNANIVLTWNAPLRGMPRYSQYQLTARVYMCNPWNEDIFASL